MRSYLFIWESWPRCLDQVEWCLVLHLPGSGKRQAGTQLTKNLKPIKQQIGLFRSWRSAGNAIQWWRGRIDQNENIRIKSQKYPSMVGKKPSRVTGTAPSGPSRLSGKTISCCCDHPIVINQLVEDSHSCSLNMSHNSACCGRATTCCPFRPSRSH